MASQLRLHAPSPAALLLTKLGIVLLVLMTGLVSAMLVRSQLDRYEIQPEQIPIADLKTWDALGR